MPITSYKGVAVYSSEIDGLHLQEEIEREPKDFGIENPALEKIVISSERHKKLVGIYKFTIKFFLDGIESPDQAHELTKDLADSIFNMIAYCFDTVVNPTSFEGAPISKEIFDEDGRKSCTLIPMPVVVKSTATGALTFNLAPSNLKKLESELQHSNSKRNLYCSLYRLSWQLTDPISRLMILYGILLQLTGGTQAQADDFIRNNEKGVIDKPSRVKGKSHILQTIYTYLRNEVGHPDAGKHLSDTHHDIKKHINGLSSLVKAAIQRLT